VSEDEEMKTHRHRRHSTEFKLRIVQAYLNGEGSIKGIARQHDISHNLLRIWLEKFRRGELTEEGDRKERIREYEVKVAALERKVGQLTMEIDLLKKLQQGTRKKKEKPSVISGPVAFPSSKGAAS
jgi:transposase